MDDATWRLGRGELRVQMHNAAARWPRLSRRMARRVNDGDAEWLS